jgi:hypothetical protein
MAMRERRTRRPACLVVVQLDRLVASVDAPPFTRRESRERPPATASVADILATMVARSGTIGALAVLIGVVIAAPASAGSPPKIGHYAGTSTTNAVNNGPQTFGMSISHSSCASAGGKVRHKAYCVTVNVQGGPQATCADGTIAEEFFPVYEPIALSAKRTISHAYTLYAGPGGQVSDMHLSGTSKVGTFEFSLKVSASGTATGTMNYSVAGCNSGPLKITAKRKK